MLIGIDSSHCSLSLRNRSTLCSTTKCHQNKSDLKNVFVLKSFFFNIFYSFNPNHAYWNQRRLFSGNLPGVFIIFIIVMFLIFAILAPPPPTKIRFLRGSQLITLITIKNHVAHKFLTVSNFKTLNFNI